MISREKKLEAIKAILGGTPANHVLPVIEVVLVEAETETRIIVIRAGEQVLNNDMVKPWLAAYKKRMPDKFIEVTRISKALFDKYEAELEAEY